MGIRKTIASGLIAAAHHLQHDRSKEQLIRKTNDVRRKIARFIEPIWSVQAGLQVQTLEQLLPQSRGIYYMKSSWTTSFLPAVPPGLTHW